MTKAVQPVWHVLDVSSVPVEEFASALHTLVPTLGWLRQSRWFAPFHSAVSTQTRLDPPLDVACFKLQRGFSNPLLDTTLHLAENLTSILLAHTSHPQSSPLVCTSPFYASVAERWPGPVIYYSTDFTFAYDHLNPRRVLTDDRRLCAVATLVFPNSKRIGDYLIERAGCDAKKVICLPNATRGSNILEYFASVPSELPDDIKDLGRPIAGVIGNLAANLDWILLEHVIQSAPWLSWVFVGPTSMQISDRKQGQARDRVMHLGPRVRFVGSKPYGFLKDYARCLDVAILPYCKREPTFSGSATRFYEHLAACRPMLATRGVDQLLEKEPLLRLVDDQQEMLAALEELRSKGFQDSVERIRWTVSRNETWLNRATAMVDGLAAVQPRPSRIQGREKKSSVNTIQSVPAQHTITT